MAVGSVLRSCSLDSLCLPNSPWACTCAETALKDAGTCGLPRVLAFIHFQLYPHLAPLFYFYAFWFTV